MSLALIGASAGAAGKLLGGIASGDAAHYQAVVAANNAQIARQNASYSAGATAAQTEGEGLKVRQQESGARAALAANGLDVNTGSPAAVQESNRTLGNLDVATVANRGARQVYGYQAEATSDTAQARLDQAQVIPDYAGGVLGAAGSIAGARPNLPGGSPSGNDISGDGSGGFDDPSVLSGAPNIPSPYQFMGGNPASGDWDAAGGSG